MDVPLAKSGPSRINLDQLCTLSYFPCIEFENVNHYYVTFALELKYVRNKKYYIIYSKLCNFVGGNRGV